jgi:hypothetical protein
MTPISLDFMPSFYSRHLGLRWGEGYYFDPAYRAEVEIARDRFLHDILGRYGVGSSSPTPSPCLSIQPVDLIMRTQGAEWRFPPDATVESWGQPWRGLSVAEIVALDPRAAAAHPVVDAVIAQYAELRKLYGDRADVLGVRSGTMVIHGPYTTAHQLMGEDLFMLMVDNPAGARQVFAKTWAIYRAVFGRIAEAVDAPPATRVHIGDCAASLVSADTYRECVLPADNAIVEEFDACGYHSCGPSTHLLGEFAALRSVDAIQLGPGTDLGAADTLLPGNTELQPLVDPVVVLQGTPGQIHDLLTPIITLLRRRNAGTLCAWSFDAATPIRNVEAIYETSVEMDWSTQ